MHLWLQMPSVQGEFKLYSNNPAVSKIYSTNMGHFTAPPLGKKPFMSVSHQPDSLNRDSPRPLRDPVPSNKFNTATFQTTWSCLAPIYLPMFAKQTLVHHTQFCNISWFIYNPSKYDWFLVCR